MEQPVRIFTIYAKEDEPFVEQLTAHLSLLRRKGIIKDYYDKEVSPVETWDEQSRLFFSECNYILFLVSPALLESGYYNDTAIQNAFSKKAEGHLKIHAVLIRNCDFSNDPLSHFELLPANGQAVESALWTNRENAWKAVTGGLTESITGEKPMTSEPIPPANSFTPAPVTRRGMSWLLQLLLSIVALGTMGAITYFVVNYEPESKATTVTTNVYDSNIIAPETEPIQATVEPVENLPKKNITPKNNKATKDIRIKKTPIKPIKDTIHKEGKDTIAKAPPPPPPPKTPSIQSAQLEQMLFDFSQGKGAENDFSVYLCNKLETMVRFDKKTMTFQQMCNAIREIRPKKIKKISVVSMSYEGGCIGAMEVTLKKKGLFN